MMQQEIRSPTALFLERATLSWWWVAFFVALCFMLFQEGQRQRQRTFHELDLQLREWTTAKAEALTFRKSLLLEINSQSDPRWIELVLRKGLGVVPEGQVKFYFTPTAHD